MGMAASQARLLTITARMHDIEFQAQSIQNAKLSLATQSDQVYKEYLEALDATTLTVKDYQGNPIPAHFNNLCGKNAIEVGNFRYALRDSKGRLLVSDEIAKAYSSFKSICPNGNAYDFAMYMLGFDADEYETYNKATQQRDDMYDPSLMDTHRSGTLFLNAVENVYQTTMNQNIPENIRSIKEAMIELEEQGINNLDEQKKEEYDLLRDKYFFLMTKSFGKEIYAVMQKLNQEEICGQEAAINAEFKQSDLDLEADDFNEDDFNYYANIFKQIEANGGAYASIASATSISEYNGFDGDAANDTDWLQDMIKSGRITVDKVTTDSKTGRVSFASTGVSSDSKLEYTTTSTIDKSALAKAEAEYEHKTKEIDRKDKKFDLDLSKLETQRLALKTEYESVKKIIDDNIQRTFSIFN